MKCTSSKQSDSNLSLLNHFNLLFRSWLSSPSSSSCCPPSHCLSTHYQSCRAQMSLASPPTTRSWPTWKRCALLGSPWNTCSASSPLPTSGSSSRVLWMSLTYWPSCRTTSPSSWRNPTRVSCNFRTCGVWFRFSGSCESCAFSNLPARQSGQGAELNFHWKRTAMRHIFHCHQRRTATANSLNSLQNSQKANKQTELQTHNQKTNGVIGMDGCQRTLAPVYMSACTVYIENMHKDLSSPQLFLRSLLQMFGPAKQNWEKTSLFLTYSLFLRIQHMSTKTGTHWRETTILNRMWSTWSEIGADQVVFSRLGQKHQYPSFIHHKVAK